MAAVAAAPRPELGPQGLANLAQGCAKQALLGRAGESLWAPWVLVGLHVGVVVGLGSCEDSGGALEFYGTASMPDRWPLAM